MSYYEMFVGCAKEREAAGDDLGRRIYGLLYVVASFLPNYGTKGNPYGPLETFVDGRRSLIAEDLTAGDLQALRGILEEIQDPDFRARVGDVLWESSRDYKAALVAVRAFLEAAEFHKTGEHSAPYTARLERAAQISAKLGFGKPLHQEVIAVVQKAIIGCESDLQSGLLCHRLMGIALEHEASDPTRYAALAERLAVEFAAAGESDTSHRYWELAARWHLTLKNEPEAQRCQLAAAEGLIAATERGIAEKKLGYMNAAHWMGRAVEELRHAKADAGRIKEIHRRLLNLQKQALTEMGTVSPQVDQIPGFRDAEQQTQEAASAHVRGHRFEEALARLAHVTQPTNVGELREQMAAQSDELIWDKLIGTDAVDYSGKVSDKLPPSGFGPDDEDEASIRKRMVQTTRETRWQVEVVWRIEPARVTILKEHPIRRSDSFPGGE